jgi:hypothetical protein
MHLMMQVFWDVMLCHSAQVIPDILKELHSFKMSETTQWHTKSLSSISWNYYNNVLNIVFTVHLVYIKNQDQLDAQSLLKKL